MSTATTATISAAGYLVYSGEIRLEILPILLHHNNNNTNKQLYNTVLTMWWPTTYLTNERREYLSIVAWWVSVSRLLKSWLTAFNNIMLLTFCQSLRHKLGTSEMYAYVQANHSCWGYKDKKTL